MSRPYVTALIDTYNHERFIEEAIVSVLEQDIPNAEMEVIVVDDGSTDRTPEIARKFEPRLRLLRKTNGGQASAFNAGIPEARGEIVAFLDGDDWWAQNKLSRVLATFEKEPELGFVGHGGIHVHLDGRRQLHVVREGSRFRANTLEGASLLRARKAFMGTSRMIVRSSVLKQIPPVPEILAVQADEYLFTLCAALSEVRILTEPLFFYRLHDANAFQMKSPDLGRLRRKQTVLAELAKILSTQLQLFGIEPRTIRAIIESVQAEADVLRLAIDGGWPWETVWTEWKIYETTVSNPSLAYRAFKMLNLLAALVTPPRVFYGLRAKITQSDLYLGARKRLLPSPEPPDLDKSWRTDV